MPLSGAILQQKALGFACMLGCHDFKASSGWLQKFKERHTIVGKVVSGESAAANAVGAADWLRSRVPEIFARYEAADVYNADETALFFRLLPNRTLALKHERCHGGKQCKQRLTVLLCVNMDGSDKRIPLVIGRSGRPRCFSGRNLPVKYVSNTKAWMTRALFTDWLKELDSDMQKKNKKICLLVDNCSAHHVEDLVLSNIELEFFPPNCTSVIQPLDQGIINSVKCAYRKRVIERILLNIQLKRETKIDVFMAVEMLSMSWQVTNKEVIANCFRKAGIKKPCPSLPAELAPDDEAGDEENVEPTPSISESWKELHHQGGVDSDVNLDDFINSDAYAITTEELDDDSIIESVTEKRLREDSTDSEQELEASTDNPTANNVMDAIDVLRRHAGKHSQEQALLALSTYERHIMPTLVKKRQAVLTDFFTQ